jgi:cytochrome c-type biogenesis protein CcmH
MREARQAAPVSAVAKACLSGNPGPDASSSMPPTPLFWLVALVLVGATVAALVWPLLRARAPRVPETDEVATTDIYRDQKRQLDAELAAGAITPEERDAGVDELASRLGADLATAQPVPVPVVSRSPYVVALLLVAAIPVTALLLYETLGSPASLQRAARGGAAPAPSHEQIEEMVAKLAARMRERPDDPTGWRLLARAYASMGRFAESVAAFEEAAKRGTEDAALLADWADALAMRNQSLAGEPSALIERALALDPNDPKALALAATVALERKDVDGAVAYWRKLRAQLPADSEDSRQIDAMIADAKGGASKAPSIAGASSPPAAGATAEALAATAISGRVSLDPAIRERVGATDTLFIYARPASGSRMPLAVIRAKAGELPRDFKLDDSMAMSPAARLSGAGEVIVEARISKAGSATPAAGDVQGTSAPVKPGTRDVSVVIHDVVR